MSQGLRLGSLWVGLFVVYVAGEAVAQTVHVSTFDSNAEGWAVVDYPDRSHVPMPATTPVPWDPATGNPAGSLRIGDLYLTTGIAAPAEWLGDASALYGGRLEYEILIRYTDEAPYPAVVLNGGSRSLYFNATPPPLGEWYTFSIPLTEQGWLISNVFLPPTPEEFRSVLANLQGLYILTEWRTGPDDTSVDNIRVTRGCSRQGDFDCDGDADLNDFAHFQLCFNGTSRPPAISACGDADFDSDADVDLNDFAVFQLCFNGTRRAPACP